eukprot:CAMPEP_0116157084 /NCGR_PEP_ID=MMETSP0329-20121206/23161_1 /TAXON_ID=697910 /ORGANISM="Pseudo-nitzschia arenysensis, Strain B593" /LENGTH=626 /DNA_ID=CAMNT_0003654179 /DNA_START=197 /DNA_END=2078 /DNA_ORIENTATION=+
MKTRRNENDDYSSIASSIASTALSSSDNTTTRDGNAELYGCSKETTTTTTNTAAANNNHYQVMDIDEAIDRLGMGWFQIQIVLACGLCFASDAMEYLLLSYLGVILKSQWALSEGESDLISSVVFLGALVGTLVLTPLGDKLGRKIVFGATSSTISIFGVMSAFCTSYTQILMVRFMVGFGIGGLTVPYDTLGEFMPNSRRGKNMLSMSFFWISASLMVPVFAWLTVGQDDDGGEFASWRGFVLLCSMPSMISTILGFLFVPESPRWLVTRGKDERALQILRQAAAKNGADPFLAFPEGVKLVDHTNKTTTTVLPPKEDDQIISDGIQQDIETTETDKEAILSRDSSVAPMSDSSCLVCSNPQWRKMSFFLGIQWYGLTFMYYGAIMAVSIVFSNTQSDKNAESNDDDEEENKFNFDYVALLISSSAEIVGLTLAIVLVDWVGRVPTQVWGYAGGGFCLLLLGILDFRVATTDDGKVPQRLHLIAFAFFSRMFIMGATAITWLHTAELLPTRFRATGHGLANALGRVGGMTCPFIVSRDNSLRTIGIVMFSVGLVTSLSVHQLPETAGKALGDFGNADARQEESNLPASNSDVVEMAMDERFEEDHDQADDDEEDDQRMIESFEIL